jgi:hypothetical protein
MRLLPLEMDGLRLAVLRAGRQFEKRGIVCEMDIVRCLDCRSVRFVRTLAIEFELS